MSIRDRIPGEQRQRLRQQIHRIKHPARMGNLRRTTPLSDAWGYDRGTPVDRYYIEQFLEENRADIHGRVLEVKSSDYTERFGSNLEERGVLDVDPSNPKATVIADLATADGVTANSYNCFILTQTLQFIYDTNAALAQSRRLLSPGGVLLATVPALSRMDRRMPDYWRFTPDSARKMFSDAFGAENVAVQAYGNVLTAIAFLTGMAYQELVTAELEERDRFYPVIVGVRAVRRD